MMKIRPLRELVMKVMDQLKTGKGPATINVSDVILIPNVQERERERSSPKVRMSVFVERSHSRKVGDNASSGEEGSPT